MEADPQTVIRRYMALTADLQARVIFLEAALEGFGASVPLAEAETEGTAA